MKPFVFALTLLLLGCTASSAATIHQEAWYCWHPPDLPAECQRCVNISTHVQDLLAGRPQADGRRDLDWIRVPPRGRVQLCRPGLTQLAEVHP